jgi:hypothetical protein
VKGGGGGGFGGLIPLVLEGVSASSQGCVLPSKIHFAVNLSFQEDKRHTAISTA